MHPPGVRAQQVGNPVRREIAAVSPPSERFADRKGPLRVLVFGGSQGAARLNAVLPAALAMIEGAHRPHIIHQAGDRHIDSARELYAKHGVEADVRAFIDDMAEVYAWADLVVCRSGALTVSEIAAVGLGAVFIPFAAAVDDHQTRNAKFLVDANAGILIPEAELTPLRLFEELRNLFASDRAKLADMAARARSLAITDADVRLADACMDVAGGVR